MTDLAHEQAAAPQGKHALAPEPDEEARLDPRLTLAEDLLHRAVIDAAPEGGPSWLLSGAGHLVRDCATDGALRRTVASNGSQLDAWPPLVALDVLLINLSREERRSRRWMDRAHELLDRLRGRIDEQRWQRLAEVLALLDAAGVVSLPDRAPDAVTLPDGVGISHTESPTGPDGL
jgi:hypothetical protein